MKIILLIILIFYACDLSAQQTVEWINKLENPEYESKKLNDENVKDKYINYDFSTLLIPKRDFFGYIGSKYRRIKIYYNSISKDQNKDDIYIIKGISLVGDNKCNFAGTIIIDQIREYKNMHFGVDNHLIDTGIKAQGVLIGSYLFRELAEQNHSGVFEGMVTLLWYLDKYNIIHYDQIESYSDSYANNQHVGSWTEYGKQNSKTCNWGEYRIPFSGDLDIGAGEFYANPKYKDQGWSDLIDN